MRSASFSRRSALLAGSLASLLAFETQSPWARRKPAQVVADLTFGNPQEPPLPGVVEALQTWSQPLSNDWFAYQTSEPEAQAAAAASLRAWSGLPFEPDDIAMTNGAFGALLMALQTLTDPGDEVIFNLPTWPAYDAVIRAAEARPVRVGVDGQTFDLDLEAIRAAITERTRVIIVNSPNNPTGRVYPPRTLRLLATLLTEASERHGRPIYLLSDEPYNRIVFDGKTAVSPACFYPYTLIAYSYGKVLLAPGERIGYLALAPAMPDREALRRALLVNQIAHGWAFPNIVLQRALPDLERCSIDLAHYQRKRDRMVAALRGLGYELHAPEGAFYLLPRSPLPDDEAFAALLARRGVYVMPGLIFELPGYFRISLTATDEMLERALPVLDWAIRKVRQRSAVAELAADD
jgi:aspartate aminotransferase